MVGNIREFILKKFIFPKVLIIDNPGIIISKSFSRYSKKEVNRRIIYYFEDTIVDLQSKTLRELGKQKTEELWYKIGKDIGVEFLSSINMKKIPSWLLNNIIKYTFESLGNTGATVTQKITYKKEGRLILQGTDNIVCRKNSLPALSLGLVGGIMSQLLKTNVEAKTYCKDCPKTCLIIADKNFKQIYTPLIKNHKKIYDYNKLNFPNTNPRLDNIHSLKNLMNFKKISLSNKSDFLGKTITISSLEFFRIIIKYYQKINKMDVLENSLTQTAEKIAKDLLRNEKDLSYKTKFILAMLCSFGWGFPKIKVEKNTITLQFTCIPILKFHSDNTEYLCLIMMAKGYFNQIFNNKFKIKSIKKGQDPASLIIKYQS